MSPSHRRRWFGVIAAATLCVADLVVLDVVAAPSWSRSAAAYPAPPGLGGPPTDPPAIPEPRAEVPMAAAPSEAPTAAAPAEPSSTVADSSRLEPVRFAPRSSQLGREAQDEIRQVARRMRAEPAVTLLLRGHTDAGGSDADNELLSLMRASAVREYLLVLGVPRIRARVEGLGSREPEDPTDTAEARARNRRVEILWKP